MPIACACAAALMGITTLARRDAARIAGTVPGSKWPACACVHSTSPACVTSAPANGGATSRSARFGESRSEEHTSEIQSLRHLVCRLLLEKKKKKTPPTRSTTFYSYYRNHTADTAHV